MKYIIWSRDADFGIDTCVAIHDTQDAADISLRNARKANDGWHVHWIQCMNNADFADEVAHGLKAGRSKYI